LADVAHFRTTVYNYNIPSILSDNFRCNLNVTIYVRVTLFEYVARLIDVYDKLRPKCNNLFSVQIFTKNFAFTGFQVLFATNEPESHDLFDYLG